MTVTMDELDYVREHVRQVPDFPKPGILFLDITTATKDAKAFKYIIDYFVEHYVIGRVIGPGIDNIKRPEK